MHENVSILENRINYSFKDKELAELALTHSSYANEKKINRRGDYERLEFLGDAVLELVVSEFLYENYPAKKEGEMTRTRAALVCESTLSKCAREFGLPSMILLGKGEKTMGGSEKDSILCDIFEAIAGALYLDGGFECAKKYITGFLLKDWENKALFVDSKSILQEEIQKKGSVVTYENRGQEGPDNHKVYTEAVLIDGRQVHMAKGFSRKSAQQQAAYEYLLEIKKQENK